MAHHVAELIQEVENAKPNERPEKMLACREAILDLWKHRHIRQHGKGSFDQLEPILKVLANLDPDNDIPRYFRSIRSSIDEVEVDEETSEWLQRAEDLDHSAKLLVGFFVSQAARSAVDQSRPWVQMAEKAGVDDDTEHEIYRALSHQLEQLEAPVSDDVRKRRKLNRHIDRLEAFAETALELVETFRDQTQGESTKPESFDEG